MRAVASAAPTPEFGLKAHMFDIAWSELLVIMVVALVVIGPKDLPRALKVAGSWVRRARGLAAQFQGTVDAMVRESDMQDLRSDLRKAQQDFDTFSTDPGPIPAGPPASTPTGTAPTGAESAGAEPDMPAMMPPRPATPPPPAVQPPPAAQPLAPEPAPAAAPQIEPAAKSPPLNAGSTPS